MTRLEEYRTIGTEGFNNESISENELRAEWNELYPDRQIPMARNGHGAEDFGPSRTAGQTPISPRPPMPRPSNFGQPGSSSSEGGAVHKGGSRILKRHLGAAK